MLLYTSDHFIRLIHTHTAAGEQVSPKKKGRNENQREKNENRWRIKRKKREICLCSYHFDDKALAHKSS